MRILLIHQNFPGQFRSLAYHLHSRGHDLVAICSHQRSIEGSIKIIRYQPPPPLSGDMSLSQQLWCDGLERATRVAKICSQLNDQGWKPDCILAHSGWGETIALNLVWEHIRVIIWPELWVHPVHGGYGVDPELPSPDLSHSLDQLGRNSLTRAALDLADSWVMPTMHQARSLPKCFKDHRLHIIHEGINTDVASPNSEVSFDVRGLSIDRSVPTLTFVNRNLERLRGFDQFMRALPILQRNRPDLRVFIVGDNSKGYGNEHPTGKPLRQIMIDELGSDLDFERIHFLGRIPYDQLIALFQVSWVHVYLSYPFVLGWSMLEAMACGCSIVASKGMPVEEVVTDGVEALLVPLDDHIQLAKRISLLLENHALRASLGKAARRRALDYDQTVTLPLLCSLVEQT